LGGTDFSVVDDILRDLDGDYDIPGFDPDVLADLMATPELTEAAAGEYGTLPEETIEAMKSASERIQAGHEAATVGTPPAPFTPPADVPLQVAAPHTPIPPAVITPEAREQAESSGAPDVCPT